MKKSLVLSFALLIGCAKTEIKEVAVVAPEQTPSHVVASFFDAINKEDSSAYFASYSPDADARARRWGWDTSERYEFTQTNERMAEGMSSQAFVEGISKVRKAGTDSIVRIDTMVFELVKIDGKWKIATGQRAI
jgi:hypothetical protein